ncbi:MAG: hypothetical protein DMD55_15240 [Gemmatimonadetes bacterium]|nr:MAG: hypothetical protein DMD55_15240 [Gemmatimonadota bacterium]
MPARRRRGDVARGHPHRGYTDDPGAQQGGQRHLPEPEVAAGRRSGGSGHGAHGGEESAGVGLPLARRAHACHDRRAGRGPAAGGGRQAVAPGRALVPGCAAVPQRRGDCLSVDERLERYVTELFAREDSILAAIRARHDALQLPPIAISPDEGKLLHVLLRAVQAVRVLEIGALAGYSGVWLARALPSHGRLTTIEKDPRHAALARRAFAEAGLAERVQLIEGAALAVLPALAPGFDAVFVDADKEPLAQYFDWSVRLLRPGGLLLCDNAFFHGSVVDDADCSPGTEGVRAFNRLAATDPRVVSAVVPIRDGLVIGVRVPG